MAELIAWGQLRTGGWRGAAPIDDLMAWARLRDWTAPLLKLAFGAARESVAAWAASRGSAP